MSRFYGQTAPMSQLANKHRTALHLLVTGLVLLSLHILRVQLKNLYTEIIPPRLDSLQNDYREFAMRFKPSFWLELGKPTPNGSDSAVRFIKREVAAAATLSGFTAGEPWPRVVSWHVRATEAGTIELAFPPGAISQIAVYMTDGDSFFRASRIFSGAEEILAEGLHNGRWYPMSVTDAESKGGKKVLRFNQLTGRDVAVSALIGR